MKNIFRKNSTKTKLPPNRLYFNVNELGYLQGWAVSIENKEAQVVVEIRSQSDAVCMAATAFRPDIAMKGLHSTGHCGFGYDIADWQDQNISIKVVGILAESSQPEPTSPLLFIHIPKTAGTSFKNAAIKYVGEDFLTKYYGVKSSESSSWVSELVVSNNYSSLYRQLKERNSKFYIGHMHAMPSASVFPILNVATIMRHPVAQVMSHYNHFVRWLDYKGTIVEYITSKQFKNIQSRITSPLPISLVGFIGITEDYNNSLSIFNRMYDYHLEPLRSNVNDVKSVARPDDELINLIIENNLVDMKLYDYVYDQQQRRLAIEKQGEKWCFGSIRQVTDSYIRGYACWHNSEDCVTVQLVNENGEVLQEVEANQYRPGLCRFNPPRNGFIGFNISVKNITDDVSVIVKSTGQVLIDEFQFS